MTAADNDVVAMTEQLFGASDAWISVLALDGAVLAANACGRAALAVERVEAVRGRAWRSFWRPSDQLQMEDAILAARSGRAATCVAQILTGNGAPTLWEASIWPICDAAGQPTHLIAMARDVTERRRQEEAQVLLAGELSHRIKNMFAVVDGVIAMSGRAVASARPFADALRSRLREVGRAMAYVAPAPDKSEGAERSLLGLLAALLQPYGGASGEDQRIFIAGDDLDVSVGAITPLALIMNELATNSIKYGVLGAAGGRLDLDVRSEAERLRICWRETLGETASPRDAAPLDQRTIEPGFGTALLEHAVVRQLGGAVTRQWSVTGVAVQLDFPQARVAPPSLRASPEH